MSDFEKIWEETAARAPFAIPAGLGPALAQFRDELARWNEIINLVRYRDDAELASRHLLDSLAGASAIPFGVRMADVGTGAGFPGLIIALARPDLTILLVEAARKKANFLRHMRREWNLPHVEIKAVRTDKLEPSSFDAVTGRAAAKPSEFVETVRPLLAPGGAIYLWTTPEGAASVTGMSVTAHAEYVLPGDDVRRTLAVINPT
ncbi:MAG: 16S rRNA (guanine(527)-N(7))-methyltransferase RsmG [Deltaproteobacteria bacterium]|nr:16S rRNA (guanine(527)-N(7))-methyltransferase RsmG [Deltaproteobacteria bacterium]